MTDCVVFFYSFLWSNLSSLHRNQTNTYSICTLHPALRKSLKSGRKGDRTLTAAWEISNSIAFSSVSVDWLKCSYAFSQTFVDAEYRSGRWGGKPVPRKSKHRSRWQNTDHPGDLDLPCSLFLHHSLWPLAPQPKAMISPAVFTHCVYIGLCVCVYRVSSTRACEHHDWQ